MKITKTSPLTGKPSEMDMPITEEDLHRWEKGGLIQDVMPQLTPGQREFILTGYTPEDWEILFPPEEDD